MQEKYASKSSKIDKFDSIGFTNLNSDRKAISNKKDNLGNKTLRKMDVTPSYRKYPIEDTKSQKPPIKLPKSEKKGRNKDSIVAPKDRNKFNKAYKEFTKSMHEKVSLFETKNSFSDMYKTSMKNSEKYSKFEENDSF